MDKKRHKTLHCVSFPLKPRLVKTARLQLYRAKNLTNKYIHGRRLMPLRISNVEKNIWAFAPRTQHMLQRQHPNERYLKGCLKDLTWNVVWIIIKQYLLFHSHWSLNPRMIKFSAKLSFFQGTVVFSCPDFEMQLFVQICNVQCGGRCWVEFGLQWCSLSVGSQGHPKQALNPKDAFSRN